MHRRCARAQDDDPAVLKLAEPDFTLVALPTSLRLPKFKSAFRVTHRFTRPLGDGDFGDLAGDLFGLDSGARIGLEYRFGIIPNGQIGIHRTSDKTIEFFAQYGLLRQGASVPVDVSAHRSASTAPTTSRTAIRPPSARSSRGVSATSRARVCRADLGQQHQPAAEGAGRPQRHVPDRRRRAASAIRPTVYVVGEIAPRAAGYKPGVNHGSFAIEKRAGGHTFQLNFSNAFGTTMGQVARGGPDSDDWYHGLQHLAQVLLMRRGVLTSASGNLRYHRAAGSLDIDHQPREPCASAACSERAHGRTDPSRVRRSV